MAKQEILRQNIFDSKEMFKEIGSINYSRTFLQIYYYPSFEHVHREHIQLRDLRPKYQNGKEKLACNLALLQ